MSVTREAVGVMMPDGITAETFVEIQTIEETIETIHEKIIAGMTEEKTGIEIAGKS
jgi:hypothetical protein